MELRKSSSQLHLFLLTALGIQQELLHQDSSNSALLELADTYCNIGGLCLEWVRQRGPNPQHIADAERSFREALQIRTATLGETHALTNQVRALHQMAQSTQFQGRQPPESSSSRAPTPSSTATSQQSPSPRSTATTTVHANVPPPASRRKPNTASYPQYSTPIGVPDTPVRNKDLNTSTDTPRSTRTADLSPWSRATKGAFDPFEEGNDSEDGEEEPNGPQKNQNQNHFDASPFDDVLPSSANIPEPPTVARMMSQEDELDLIESEESCLLQTDGSGGGPSISLTSFASIAGNRASTTEKHNSRSALLNTAKTLLDGGNTDSGDVTSTYPLASNSNPARELGLTPLGGEWGGGSNNRITPAVLDNPAKHLQTVYNCAVNFMKRNKNMEALHLLEIVEEIQREQNGPSHEHVAAALYNLGVCHLRMESYYKAMQSFEEATRIRHMTQGRNSPLVAASLVKVGISLLQLQRLEDALWIFREALSVRESTLGNAHPLTAKIQNNIGCVHVELHQFELARDLFESALATQQTFYLKNPNDGTTLFAISTMLQNLGCLHQKQGETEFAIKALNEALQVKEKILGYDHIAVLRTIDAIAETWLDTGNSAMALKFYKEHMDRLTSAHGTVEEALTLVKVSRVHLNRRDVVSQQKALQMATRIVQSDPSTEGTKERLELEKRIQQDMKTSSSSPPSSSSNTVGTNNSQQNRSWV